METKRKHIRSLVMGIWQDGWEEGRELKWDVAGNLRD